MNLYAHLRRLKVVSIDIYRTGRVSYNTPFVLQLFIEIILQIKFLFYIKYHNYDLYHIHSSSYFGFIRNFIYIIILKILNKKIIIHIHGGGFTKFYKDSCYIIKKIIKFAINSSNKIIFVSKSQFSFINDSDQNMLVIPNAFNKKLFYKLNTEYTRTVLNLPLNKKIIVNISNLYFEKGQKVLIKSLKIIENKYDFLCIIIGKGPLYNELNKEIAKLNLKEKVMLIGEVPNDRLNCWLNAADLFVLSSLIEGNPTVMFESLAVGLPFVGTKVGGVPEVITSEDYGLLAEPGNAKDLAEKIQIALNKEWDREKIRQYAQQFTWDNIARQILKVYEKVLSESNLRR